MKTTTKKDRINNERNRHNSALLALAKSLNPDVKLSGLQIWRKLRILENIASRAMCHYSSEPTPFNAWGMSFNFAGDENAVDNFCDIVSRKVAAVFGVRVEQLPPSFRVNRDPRGYALKLDSGNGEKAATAFELHQDWGRNQILAPDIR